MAMDAKRLAEHGKANFEGYDLTLDLAPLITKMIEHALEEGAEETPPYISFMSNEDDLMIRFSLGFIGHRSDLGPTWEFPLFKTVLDYTIGTEIEEETVEDAKAALASIRAAASRLEEAIDNAERLMQSSP